MANGLFTLKQVNQGLRQSAWTGQKTPSVQYLVVAGGGGGGGSNMGGGGGAGGLLTGVVPVTYGSSITVTVGGGGTGGLANNVNAGGGSNGQNSVFGSIVALGGGYGGGYNNANGQKGNGGSGGSGGGGGQGLTGSQGTFNQGNGGGTGSPSAANTNGGGGGGGAGSAGADAGISSSQTIGGRGGSGIASAISGTVTTYAGGGGGGQRDTTIANGGAGGGGGSSTSGASAAAATANTGGGGGGASGSGNGTDGGNGGSGIVIISYPDTYAAAASTSNATVTTSGSGSISFNGTNQYLNYNAQTPFALGSGDFTIEFWAYATGGFANYPSFVDFRGTSSTSSAPLIYNNNGVLVYWANGADRITSTYSWLNTWVHIAVCRIGTSTKMYANGTQVGSTYTDTNNYLVGTNAPYIGQNGLGGGYYTGYISNLRIVKGVGVYTGNFTPSTTPLQATQISGTNISAITGTSTSLLLNSNSGAWLADNSTNSNAPSNTSFITTWNSASPFATGLGYKNRVYTWTTSGSITF